VFLVGDEITEDIVSSLDVKLGRGEEADVRAANRADFVEGRSSREFPAMHQYGVGGSIFRNWRDVRAPSGGETDLSGRAPRVPPRGCARSTSEGGRINAARYRSGCRPAVPTPEVAGRRALARRFL
jgi:hypothetical protein